MSNPVCRIPAPTGRLEVLRDPQWEPFGTQHCLHLPINTADLFDRLEGTSSRSQPGESRHSALPQQVAATHQGRPDSHRHAIQKDATCPTSQNQMPNWRIEWENWERRRTTRRLEKTCPAPKTQILRRLFLGWPSTWKRKPARISASRQVTHQSGQPETSVRPLIPQFGPLILSRKKENIPTTGKYATGVYSDRGHRLTYNLPGPNEHIGHCQDHEASQAKSIRQGSTRTHSTAVAHVLGPTDPETNHQAYHCRCPTNGYSDMDACPVCTVAQIHDVLGRQEHEDRAKLGLQASLGQSKWPIEKAGLLKRTFKKQRTTTCSKSRPLTRLTSTQGSKSRWGLTGTPSCRIWSTFTRHQ